MSSASKKLRPNEATNETGNRRFHGAFTGGFSAGHFNTVGSEEGFKPKSFVSSRTNRASQCSNVATEYMDADDGLLGASLLSKKAYDTFDQKSSAQQASVAEQVSKGGMIPGPVPSELIVKSSTSIGKQLLLLMNWKEGHAIGPHISNKLQQNCISKTTIDSNSDLRNISSSKRSSSSGSEVVISLPKRDDKPNIIIPKPKMDDYGIGFDAYQDNPEMFLSRNTIGTTSSSSGSSQSLQQQPRRTLGDILKPTKSSSGISGYIKGYGDDDAEDHVYDDSIEMISSSAKNMKGVLLLKEEMYENNSDDDDDGTFQSGSILKSKAVMRNVDKSLDQWLGSSTASSSTSSSDIEHVEERYPSDGMKVLLGFKLSINQRQEILDTFPLLQPPRDFRPDPQKVFTSAQREDLQKLLRLQRKTFLSQGLSVPVADENLIVTNTINSSSSSLSTTTANELQQFAKSNLSQSSSKVSSSNQSLLKNLSSSSSDQKSIFEYLSEESRQKLKTTILQQETAKIITNTTNIPDKAELLSAIPILQATDESPKVIDVTDTTTITTTTNRPYLASDHAMKTTFAGLSTAFKCRFVSASTPSETSDKINKTIVGLTTSKQHSEAMAKLVDSTDTFKTSTVSTSNIGDKVSDIVMGNQHSIAQLIKNRKPRITSIWCPTALLCKRFNVPVPDSSSPSLSHSIKYLSSSVTSAGAGVTMSIKNNRESELYNVNVGQYVTTEQKIAALASASSSTNNSVVSSNIGASVASSTCSVTPSTGLLLDQDEYLRATLPMSLFKNIFEDSSDDEEEEEEDKSDCDAEGDEEIPSKALSVSTSIDTTVATEKNQISTSAPTGNNTVVEAFQFMPERVIFRKPVKSNLTTVGNKPISSTISSSKSHSARSISARSGAKATAKKPTGLVSFESEEAGINVLDNHNKNNVDGDDNDLMKLLIESEKGKGGVGRNSDNKQQQESSSYSQTIQKKRRFSRDSSSSDSSGNNSDSDAADNKKSYSSSHASSIHNPFSKTMSLLEMNLKSSSGGDNHHHNSSHKKSKKKNKKDKKEKKEKKEKKHKK